MMRIVSPCQQSFSTFALQTFWTGGVRVGPCAAGGVAAFWASIH